MEIRHFILATAGHVDHGKSALVKALTGTDPDRLPEEKARGVTIDLGFAHLELSAALAAGETTGDAAAASPVSAGTVFSIGIVDVPGHEDFVKNMVAGVGSIDLALLVVAVDDGWMPQTEEHLQILGYLGVDRGVVAVTKIDLAANAAEQEAIVSRVREHLKGSTLADAPIVCTSTLNGRGLEELKQTLALVLTHTPPSPDIGKPRLPIDRVFSLRGIGTVVTGTLTGGTLRRGQQVCVQPSGVVTRIRSLQTHNREVESSGPGRRTALNLPLAIEEGKGEAGPEARGLQRGAVVTLPGLGAASTTVSVLLEKSPRLAGQNTAAARPLKDGARVQVHHGSGHWPARIALMDSGSLEPGAKTLAQLRFEAPVFLFVGDRFIVRDWSEQHTLAGGMVLEVGAGRRHFRSATNRAFLEARAAHPNSAAAFVASQLKRDHGVLSAALLVASRFSGAQIEEAVRQLEASGRVRRAGEWLVDTEWWWERVNAAGRLVQEEHKAHPERLGLEVNALRQAIEPMLPASGLFPLLVAALQQQGYVQSGTIVRHASHRPALPPHLQNAGERVRQVLQARRLDPPSRKELAPDAAAQQALRFLIQTGQAIELSPDVVLDADAYAEAVERIRQVLQTHGPSTVSELRQELGTSRRIMIPLLEKLDREGVTVRQGDRRVLRQRS